MNPPIKSKINWTSLFMAIVGVVCALGVVPPEYEDTLTELTLIIGPVLIATFRTWFTG